MRLVSQTNEEAVYRQEVRHKKKELKEVSGESKNWRRPGRRGSMLSRHYFEETSLCFCKPS